MGMEYRPYYLAREWVKNGHRVDIFAADFSHLRMYNPTIEKDFETENIDGITYHWIKTNSYHGNGAKRAFTMFEFVYKLKRHSKQIVSDLRPDIIICSSTYPLDTYAGQQLKQDAAKIGKHPVLVHEIHDVWPETLVEIGGMSKRHPFVQFLQKAEDSAYKRSDKVVSLLPFTKQHCVEHGMVENKFVFIPNGIDQTPWDYPQALPKRHEEILVKARNDNKFIVGYFGGHALSNALDELLDIAKATDDSSILFVLVGNGVEKPRLMERATEEHLENVVFLDPISKNAIPSFCSKIDCSYMAGLNSPLYRFGLSLNKMVDSMRSGVPVVCEITTPSTYVEEFNCGIRVDSNDTNGALSAILELKNMSPEERKVMGENGKRAAIDHFDYHVLATSFLKEVSPGTDNSFFEG